RGRVVEVRGSAARLKDSDASSWEVTTNVRELLSKGFTFAWWRITVTLPEEIDGMKLEGSHCVVNTNVENYGEIYVDSEIDLVNGVVVGFNSQQRIVVNPSVTSGAKHT